MIYGLGTVRVVDRGSVQVRRVRLADSVLYRKTVNISRNLAFGRREKDLGVQKASGGAKMAIRGAKLTFGGGEKIGSTKAQGGAKSL